METTRSEVHILEANNEWNLKSGLYRVQKTMTAINEINSVIDWPEILKHDCVKDGNV